jgi:hypothetical protein
MAVVIDLIVLAVVRHDGCSRCNARKNASQPTSRWKTRFNLGRVALVITLPSWACPSRSTHFQPSRLLLSEVSV